MEILIFMEIKQWRIQDFPDFPGVERQLQTGGPIIWPNFAENCMKMKKIGPGGSAQNFTM